MSRDLRIVAALARRALKQNARRPQFLAPILIIPTLLLAVNTGAASSATKVPGFPDVHGFFDFELAAAMMQSSLLAGVSAGIALALDIEAGFMDRLIASPARRSAVVTGRLGAAAALGAFAAVWFLAIGLIFGAHVKGGVLGALTVVVLLSLSATAFGALGAAIALKSGRASVAQGIFPIVFVILFMSNAFFPRELMHEPAHTIAAWNPISLIVDGLREPIISGVSGTAVLHGIAGVAIVAVLGGVLSALALRSRLRAA